MVTWLASCCKEAGEAGWGESGPLAVLPVPNTGQEFQLSAEFQRQFFLPVGMFPVWYTIVCFCFHLFSCLGSDMNIFFKASQGVES